MPPPNHDDSQNPYRATFIDEKPVEAADFFRAEPQYRKLTPGSVGRTSYAMFMLHKWQFIGLGFAQGLFIVCPTIAVFWLLVQHPDVGRQWPWLIVVVPILVVLMTVFMVVVSISVSLRILRKEKMVFLSTLRDATRLARSILHAGIYMCLFWLGLSPLFFVARFGTQLLIVSNWTDFHLSWIVAGIVLLFILAFGIGLCIGYCLIRTFYAIHFIVDRQKNCLAAMRASWHHTHGNFRAITAKDGKIQALNLSMFVFAIFTGGMTILVTVGFTYCAGAEIYLMLTGQCELLEELPDEW